MTFEHMAFMPFDVEKQLPKWPAAKIELAPVVTAVGAWCDTGFSDGAKTGRTCFPVRIDEFVEMSNGVRISVRWDRGVTVSWFPEGDKDDGLSEADLLTHLEGGLLPDEGETEDVGELRSWHEYALRLHALGVLVTAEQLRALPYLTEFSSDLSRRLTTSE